MKQKEQTTKTEGASGRSTSRVGSLFNHIFKFRLWLDLERVQEFSRYMGDSARRLFIPPKQGQTDSFEAVTKELGLTDEALNLQANALWRWSMVLLVTSVGILAVTFYHGIQGHIRACLLSILVTMIGLIAAFRYHFLYFQIKTRVLGCSISTWFTQGVMGVRSKS